MKTKQNRYVLLYSVQQDKWHQETEEKYYNTPAFDWVLMARAGTQEEIDWELMRLYNRRCLFETAESFFQLTPRLATPAKMWAVMYNSERDAFHFEAGKPGHEFGVCPGRWLILRLGTDLEEGLVHLNEVVEFRAQIGEPEEFVSLFGSYITFSKRAFVTQGPAVV